MTTIYGKTFLDAANNQWRDLVPKGVAKIGDRQIIRRYYEAKRLPGYGHKDLIAKYLKQIGSLQGELSKGWNMKFLEPASVIITDPSKNDRVLIWAVDGKTHIHVFTRLYLVSVCTYALFDEADYAVGVVDRETQQVLCVVTDLSRSEVEDAEAAVRKELLNVYPLAEDPRRYWGTVLQDQIVLEGL